MQESLETLYPGLARPLNFSNSKYNMNATPGSLLVEVGTEVNTVSEAVYAGQLWGQGPGPCAGGHCGRRVTLYTIKKRQFAEKAPAGGDRPRRRGLVPCLLFLSKPLGGFLKPSASWGRTAETCLLFSPSGNSEIYAGFWGTLGRKGGIV